MNLKKLQKAFDEILDKAIQKEFEEWLKRRRMLETLNNRKQESSKCLHDACPECNGTGKKKDGTTCVHFISCPCPKCTFKY